VVSPIALAPGIYPGRFVASVSGTASEPITLCGGRDAIIDGGAIKSGYAFHVSGASWWNLVGFAVRGGQKGVVTDHASHVLISGLYVHDVGDEAIHLRAMSTDNTVEVEKDVPRLASGVDDDNRVDGMGITAPHHMRDVDSLPCHRFQDEAGELVMAEHGGIGARSTQTCGRDERGGSQTAALAFSMQHPRLGISRRISLYVEQVIHC